MRVIIDRIYRRLTDRKVTCYVCAESLGYIARGGHPLWLCPRCGGGQLVPLDQKGYPR